MSLDKLAVNSWYLVLSSIFCFSALTVSSTFLAANIISLSLLCCITLSLSLWTSCCLIAKRSLSLWVSAWAASSCRSTSTASLCNLKINYLPNQFLYLISKIVNWFILTLHFPIVALQSALHLHYCLDFCLVLDLSEFPSCCVESGEVNRGRAKFDPSFILKDYTIICDGFCSCPTFSFVFEGTCSICYIHLGKYIW